MEILTRLVGGVLLAIGAVVAVHTIIEPLYHVSSAASPYSPMWRIIDPLEALAVVLGVICGYIRTRSGAHDGEAPRSRASGWPRMRCSTGSSLWASCVSGTGSIS